MNDAGDDSNSWGKYAPRVSGKFILLIRRIGLAHGVIKKLIARLWFATQANQPVDISYNNVKFRLHLRDNTLDEKMLFGSKLRERLELDEIKKVVSKNGVFLDIGANIGYYSLMAASFGASKILAIEPNPIVYSRLLFNISANGFNEQITTQPIALGDKSGKVVLSVAKDDMGGSRIGELAVPTVMSVEVEMKSLINVLEEEKITCIDAFKIDVEGREDTILFPFFENAPTSLWPKLVIIEPTSQGEWQRDILSWMLKSGYKVIGETRSNAVLQLEQ